MNISQINSFEDIEIVQNDFEDEKIVDVYTSDLLSDVMANANDSNVLITIQAHNNTLAVCKLLDIKAVIICNNRATEDSFLDIAKKEKIAVFTTNLNQFQVSVLVGKNL
jgi:hypothetical protein